LELHDVVRCSADARCTLAFHFAPSRVRVEGGGARITVSGEGWGLDIHDQLGGGVSVQRSKKPMFDEANRRCDAPMLRLTRTGRQVEFRYACRFA
jgi:hypothetical protein